MTDSPALPEPALPAVFHQHGASWQIVYDAEIGAWTALQRPTPTALHIICAHDLATLAIKLDEVGGRSTG